MTKQSLAQRDRDRTATTAATDWLRAYLTARGASCPSAQVKQDARTAGHSVDALKRARRRLHLTALSTGFPRCISWKLPPPPKPDDTFHRETWGTAQQHRARKAQLAHLRRQRARTTDGV